MCSCAAYTLKAAWEDGNCVYLVPTSCQKHFMFLISNFNETMQGGWKLSIWLMMKLKLQMQSPGYTAGYREVDFSLVVWIYLPGHLPHITDLSAGAHPAPPCFLPHPLPLRIMFADSISWTCLPSSVSLVLWNRTLVKQPAESITRICFTPKLLYPDLQLLQQGLCYQHFPSTVAMVFNEIIKCISRDVLD